MKRKFGVLVCHTTLPEKPGVTSKPRPKPSTTPCHDKEIKKAKKLIETKRNIWKKGVK
jgi:hypothetical protein